MDSFLLKSTADREMDTLIFTHKLHCTGIQSDALNRISLLSRKQSLYVDFNNGCEM